MKYVVGLMLASLSMFTYAQRTPLACQVDSAAGLDWEQGRWITKSFKTDKFILVKDGSSLTLDSVAKALDGHTLATKCEANRTGEVMCFDFFGGSLLFSLTTNKGGISQLLGAASDSRTNRDSLSVRAFTCTPF